MNLTIKNLHVAIDGKEILKGVSFNVKPGEVHAIMGPNGGGKSTFASALLGQPQCQMTNSKCQIKIGSREVSKLATEERAKAGLFLAFQSPIAIPGVSVFNLLRTACTKQNRKSLHNPVFVNSLANFTKTVRSYGKFLHLDESFLQRGIHDGFSGGEKKKVEMLQALILKPKFAIFDEIDTGLDVDALKVVAKGIEKLASDGTGILVITHYQRILKYIRTDFVHILVDGRIVDSGTWRLAKKIEEKGYSSYATNRRRL